jgi:hypothetical protein
MSQNPDESKAPNMSPDEQKVALEELKMCNDDYRYRDQLIVTEFSLSMTVVALALNLAQHLIGWPRAGVLLAISLFLLIIANHIDRVNQDRVQSGWRANELKTSLGMTQTHQGFAGRRTQLIKIPAPKTMVWFVWATALLSILLTLYVVITLIKVC